MVCCVGGGLVCLLNSSAVLQVYPTDTAVTRDTRRHTHTHTHFYLSISSERSQESDSSLPDLDFTHSTYNIYTK